MCLPLLFLVLVLVGCNGFLHFGEDPEDSGDSGYDPNTLQGVINGEPFTVAEQETFSYTHGYPNTILFFYPAPREDYTPCEDPGHGEWPILQVGVTLETGTWDQDQLWEPLSIFWIEEGVHGGGAAETATLRIDEIDDNWRTGEASTISGWLSAWYSEDTHVEGNFSGLQICWDGDTWP